MEYFGLTRNKWHKAGKSLRILRFLIFEEIF